MKIEVERRGHYAIVRIDGRIVRETQADLRAELEEQLSLGVTHIGLDLEKVDYLDSAGMGCCASVQKRMADEGRGVLVVFGASPNIQKMWKLISLHRVIPILAEEKDAIALLTKDPPTPQS